MNNRNLSAPAAIIMAIITLFCASDALAAVLPIPGIDVIVRKGGGDQMIKVSTDNNGTATFRNVLEGSYTMSISRTQLDSILRQGAARGGKDSAMFTIANVVVVIKGADGKEKTYTGLQAIAGINFTVPAGRGRGKGSDIVMKIAIGKKGPAR